MLESPLDKIRAAIEQATGPGRRTPAGWQLKCPAHSDRDPSLSLSENADQHALLYCQAGCATADVLAAVQLEPRDLYPLKPENKQPDPVVATYKYVDEAGTLLYEVQRTATKRFRQRRPDPDHAGRWVYNLGEVRRVLYRLPYVLEATREGQTVYVVEGEKDVHTLESRGYVATTNPGGAGKWRHDYTESLRGAHVVIVTDVDARGTGLIHARTVAHALGPVAASVMLTQPAGGKDITDHFSLGHEIDDILIVAIDPPEPVLATAPEVTEAVDEPVSGGAMPPARKIRLTPASAFEIRPVRWLWEPEERKGRMPLGEITLVPGREGVGKSTFLAWLASQITNGNLPGIYHGQPRAVLYAATEDAWGYTIAPRMLAAGANLDLVYRIDAVEDTGPSGLILPRDCLQLPAIVEESKAAVLMCDPILSLVDERINTNYAGELRGALTPLKSAAEQAGIGIVGLVHFNKSTDTDIMTKIAGTRAWGEVARAVIAIVQDHEADEYTCVVSQIKNNLGRKDLPDLTYTLDSVELETPEGSAHVGRIRWTGESESSAEEIMQRKPISRGADQSLVREVLDWIDNANRGVTPREVCTGLSDAHTFDSVRRTMSRCAAKGQLEKLAGTGLYRTVAPTRMGGTASATQDNGSSRVATRARETTSVSRLTSPPKSEGVGVGQKGKNVPVGRDTRRADTPVPLMSCRGCFGPLDDVNGTGYHPVCDPTMEPE